MISPKPLAPRSTRGVSRAVPRSPQPLSTGVHDARVGRQYRRLAENIIREFPAPAGGTILFAGIGSSTHIADVAEHVARQLASQPDVDVALADGDADKQVLSKRLAREGDVGLADVCQQQTSVAPALVNTAIQGVRFLPFGDRCNARNPIANEIIRSTLADLRQLCHYTVIALGTNTSPLGAMLSRHSDGLYLVVQLGMANRKETSDLAGHFTRAGARLLGCVATSVV